MTAPDPSPGDDTAAAVLHELVGVYDVMERHAAAGAWDEMLELEPRRRVLEELLAGLAPLDATHRPRLEELTRRNQRLERQAIAARGKILADLGRMQEGRRMQAAYTSRSNP